MKKLAIIAAGITAVPMLAMSASVFADSTGTFGTAPDQYMVKNFTINPGAGNYSTNASLAACQEVKYSVRLDNVAFGTISNINVKVSLPSTNATTNVSTMTATGTDANNTPTTTNGTATVNLSSAQTITYEAGTAELSDSNAKLIKALPDTITGDGVNVGDLAGSATEFVTFKAKVGCPTPPTTTTTTPSTPVTTLPNTGAGNVVGIAAGAIVAGFVASRLYLSRRLAKKA